MRRLFSIIIFAIFLNICALGAHKAPDKSVYTAIEISNTTPYAGEIIIATLYARCFDKEISYISEQPTPKLNKGKFSSITPIEINERPHRILEDGREGLAIPIAKYALVIENPGKVQVGFSDLIGEANRRVKRQHPLWGTYTDIAREPVILETSSIEIIVGRLPQNKDKVAFSGALGSFNLHLDISMADIVINEPTEVIIVLHGEGFIPDEIIPDYENAFGDNIKLKSISNSSEKYYNGKSVCEKRIWRCEVVPQVVGECTIGEIKFGYFNTQKHVYEEIKSDPVVLSVKSSTIKREIINV